MAAVPPSLAPRSTRWIAAVLIGWTLVLLASLVMGQGEDARAKSPSWPSFRGTGGNGHAELASPPTTWNDKDGINILWKTPIARHGMSSPIVSGDCVFVTAANHDVRQLLCFNANTGKILWHHDVNGIPGSPKQGLPHVLDETGYAAPTAVTNGRAVAAVFGTGELVCVNFKGERMWDRHLGVPKNHYGHASSLIGHENLVIVQYDQKADQKVMALDIATGRPVWETKRRAISWSSPILVDNEGRPELILTNSRDVDGYDPKTGKHLWRVECLSGEVASSAAFADGVAFVASEGSAATAIEIAKHAAKPKILWQWQDSLPDAASLVATEDFLVIPTAFGVVTCLDAKSGKVHWEHEFDRGFSSSPILVNDRVYIVDMSGNMQAFRMSKKFEHLGEGHLGEGAYATPAFVGSRIYIRGLKHLYCIEQRK